MPLNEADRKNLSKKYVNIPDENAAAAINIANLDILIAQLQALDSSFKGLFDADNARVNLYHPEINSLAGQIRTSITESNIQDSANKVLGNFFFPNNVNVSTPTLSDGIWKQLKAYARNIVLGKTYQEVYTTQDSETVKIGLVDSAWTTILADYSVSERQTGIDDMMGPPFNLPADLADLKSAVDVWESYLNAQKAALVANTDSQESANITAAIADIDNALVEIAAWEALPDYAIDGKLDGTGIQILTDETAARLAFIPTRITQIDTRLGTIVQNLDGTISSFSGLYGARYINVDSRINLADGTLSKQVGTELAKRVQSETINNNNNYKIYLEDNVLIASKLTANANGTNTIFISDATGLLVSDTIFVTSETQSELTGTITNINGLEITLSFIVPATFTTSDLARLIKQV
jgi:hypothetical protein